MLARTSESRELCEPILDIIEEPHNPAEGSSLLYEKGSCLFNCQLKFDQLGIYNVTKIAEHRINA
ncbi:hypothetical protein [Piscirickettsia salmonis]|uniref:hypothetical protein n=1 Tax=Piscirickettsia salmonis TaxID=1238 RepID=UPI003A811C07